MQFKEVNLSDLPQCDVLAYSYSGHKIIGKLKNMADIVVCVTHDTSLSNISHYIDLDEIKPSEPKPSLLGALPNGYYVTKDNGGLIVYPNLWSIDEGYTVDIQKEGESIEDFTVRVLDIIKEFNS